MVTVAIRLSNKYKYIFCKNVNIYTWVNGTTHRDSFSNGNLKKKNHFSDHHSPPITVPNRKPDEYEETKKKKKTIFRNLKK